METEDILTTILGGNGHYCLFAHHRAGGKRQQAFFTDLHELITEANQFDSNGYDAYFALATFTESGSRKSDNVAELRSFFLDLDCGTGKEYATKRDALSALQAFCRAVHMPKPALVDSGRGIHAYWPLTESIPMVHWLPVAEAFKSLCAMRGLYADPAVTADASRVLRVPGTHNHKVDPAAPVRYLGTEMPDPVELETFAGWVGATLDEPIVPVPSDSGIGSEVMNALLSNQTYSFKTILRRVTEGTGCEQLRTIVTDQANTSEPLWRAGLSIAKYCTDSVQAMKRISDKHPGYSLDETRQKVDGIKGPYTCAKFDEYNTGVCMQCPHWGKIKSPIALGKQVEESPANTVVTDRLFAGDMSMEYTIPPFPKPYFRGKNGGVYMRTTNMDGDVDEVCIYHNDLYVVKRIHDRDEGESVVMRLHLPKDGVREFVVPLASVTSKEELRRALSEQGIAVVRTDKVIEYVVTWVNELQYTTEAESAMRQFGWTSREMTGFILGNRHITATGSEAAAPSVATVPLLPHFEPRGSLEGWKKAIDFWNREGFELQQYVVGAGFGSVLVEMSNIHCATMHLYSKQSGVAKTTMLKAATGIWGKPEGLILNEDDTLNTKMNRGEIYKNLPWAIDEITNISAEQASQLLYNFTGGKQRNRMRGSRNLERTRGEPWRLFALTTGNTGLIERVSMYKAMPLAEIQRVIECPVYDMSHRFKSKRETDDFESALDNNYGWAGEVFVRYVIQNLDEVKQICTQVQRRVDEEGELTATNRFWSAQITYTIAGLIIAKKAGLVTFNVGNVFHWAMGILLPHNKRNTMSADIAVSDVMNEFFTEHYSNILQIKSTQDARNKDGMETLVLPDAIARGKLVARYEPDTQLFFVVPKPLKQWCAAQQINYKNLIEQLEKQCEGRKRKVRMTKGTPLNLPPADVLCMRFALNLDTDEITNGEPKEAPGGDN